MLNVQIKKRFIPCRRSSARPARARGSGNGGSRLLTGATAGYASHLVLPEPPPREPPLVDGSRSPRARIMREGSGGVGRGVSRFRLFVVEATASGRQQASVVGALVVCATSAPATRACCADNLFSRKCVDPLVWRWTAAVAPPRAVSALLRRSTRRSSVRQVCQRIPPHSNRR
jgi:hypothetical protein